MQKNSLSTAKQTGFTLLEILLSVVILTIGIFGALKMHLTSLQTFQQTTYFRSALMLATELSDVILGNPEQLKQGTSNPFLKINYQASSDPIESTASCLAAECSSDQLATAQTTEWLRKITTILPNVRARVCQDDVPWNSGKRELEWECHPDSDRSMIVIKLGWLDKTAPTNRTGLSSPPQLTIPVTLPQ